MKEVEFQSFKEFRTFKEFWPFYLSQHQNPICRGLHYFGVTISILILGYIISTGQPWWSLFIFGIITPIFPWLGHFLFEKNKPASWKYPTWSILSDFKFYYYFLTGKIKTEIQKPEVLAYIKRDQQS